MDLCVLQESQTLNAGSLDAWRLPRGRPEGDGREEFHRSLNGPSRPNSVLGWTDSRGRLVDESCDLRPRDEPAASDDDTREFTGS
jgi:hypothetical protein